MLSIVAICKNEIKNINGFLASWSAVADEIVILDTGSADGSWQLLCELEPNNRKLRAHRTDWKNDFSVARNLASSLATGTWIFWADLDDRFDTASIDRLKDIVKLNPTAAYQFQVASDVGRGRWSRFMQTRLFPNWPSMLFSGAVHENLDGAVKAAGIPLFREPEIIIAHLGYADVDLRKAKAIRNLDILLHNEPETPEEYAQIGDALYVLGKYSVGLGYYAEAVRRMPEARPNLAEKLALGYLSIGALQKAEVEIALMPERSLPRLYLTGELRRIQGNNRAAKEYYSDAIHWGERELEMRQCNGDAMLESAKERLEEMEVICVLA